MCDRCRRRANEGMLRTFFISPGVLRPDSIEVLSSEPSGVLLSFRMSFELLRSFSIPVIFAVPLLSPRIFSLKDALGGLLASWYEG